MNFFNLHCLGVKTAHSQTQPQFSTVGAKCMFSLGVTIQSVNSFSGNNKGRDWIHSIFLTRLEMNKSLTVKMWSGVSFFLKWGFLQVYYKM